jgi:hypothetical protein
MVLAEGVAHLDEAAAVFGAMLDGWARQQGSRLLAEGTIRAPVEQLRRFQGFTGDYPWRWTPGDVEDYVAMLADLSQDQRARLRQVLTGMLRERAGADGRAVLTNVVNIGVGTK